MKFWNVNFKLRDHTKSGIYFGVFLALAAIEDAEAGPTPELGPREGFIIEPAQPEPCDFLFQPHAHNEIATPFFFYSNLKKLSSQSCENGLVVDSEVKIFTERHAVYYLRVCRWSAEHWRLIQTDCEVRARVPGVGRTETLSCQDRSTGSVEEYRKTSQDFDHTKASLVLDSKTCTAPEIISVASRDYFFKVFLELYNISIPD